MIVAFEALGKLLQRLALSQNWQRGVARTFGCFVGMSTSAVRDCIPRIAANCEEDIMKGVIP